MRAGEDGNDSTASRTAGAERGEVMDKSQFCTCLSISRDPYCVHHGSVDKVANGSSCRVCQRGHAKWHELAQWPLNPVALIKRIEWLPMTLTPFQMQQRIISYILGSTGIDYSAMQIALAEERKSDDAVRLSADEPIVSTRD